MKKILVILFSMAVFSATAQRFEGGLSGGLNFTQLDGDRLSGYNKIGLNAGFWVSYPFNKKWGFAMEFLYTQKGAQRTIDTGNIAATYSFDKFRINYIEMPLLATYTYKKFTGQAGLTGGYLINAKTIDYVGEHDYKDKLKPFETGILFGVAYEIDKQISVGVRWQYSVISLGKNDKQTIFTNNAFSKTILGLYNNSVTVRLNCKF